MPRQIDLFPQNLQVNNDPTNRLGVTAAQINHLNDQIPAALAKAQSLAITNFLTLLDQETGLDLLGWWKDTQDLLNFINAATQQSWMNFQNLVNSIAGGIDKDITDLIAALNSTSGDAATATANWDTLFLDLGFSVTTAAQLASWLGGTNTTAVNGNAWVTRMINDWQVIGDFFHTTYHLGTPSDAPGLIWTGGGLGNGKMTWYGAWNDYLVLIGLANSGTTPTQTAADLGTTLNTTNTNLFGSTTPSTAIQTSAVPSGISATKINNVLGGANLGADVSSVNTTVGTNTTSIASQQAWWNSLATDLWIYADLFHAYYPVGTPSDTATTTSGGRRTWYSAIADMKVLFAAIGSSPPVVTATDMGGAVTSAQSTANTATTNSQNLADAAHQAVYGGTATGTPTDIATLKNTQTSIPSENVVPVQNPNSSGMVAHGATGISWTANATAGNLLSITGSHTAALGDNYCAVPILFTAAVSTPLTSISRTVTYGSVPMSSLGTVQLSPGTWIEFFALSGLPAGAQTITAQVASINTLYSLIGQSNSYSGVGSVGPVTSNTGTAANPSQTVTSATGDMIVQAFAAWRTNAAGAVTLSAYSQTQRSNSGSISNTSGSNTVLEVGDAAGAASVSFTATASATSNEQFAGLALNLVPAPAVIGSGIRQYRASATTVSGSSGGPHLFASGFFDTTIGTPTPDMSVSNNAVTVTQAGWYHVAIRSLITAAASTGMMTFSAALYRNGSLDHILSGNSVAFNIVGAQDYTSNICGTGLVYCNAGDVLAPGYYQDGLGTFSSLTFFGEATGVQTHWTVTLANRSLL